MILVTGAYGFIGSNFVRWLNGIGKTDIIVSDYLFNGKQFTNLNDCEFQEFAHPDSLIENKDKFSKIKEIYHFGACSNTTEWNGTIMMKLNYDYTVKLFELAEYFKIPFSYSSSASIYGNGSGPLNLYAYSKKLVDDYISKKIKSSSFKIQGFRYFNVYGSNEQHKGDQASPYYKFEQEVLETGEIRIFEGSENFKRDFVPVDYLCALQYNMLIDRKSGIYDLGTGTQKSFLEVAQEVSLKHGGKIVTIPFPEYLKGHYQTNTIANMDYLKQSSLL